MSSTNFELNATIREDLGKGSSRRLRRLENLVPAIIYGGDKDPVTLTLKSNEVAKCILDEAFYASVLSVNIEGKAEKAILKDMQRHPAKDHVMHMDFLRINENQAITMNVPLHFINEDKCQGVKMGGGQVSHSLAEVEISCLPKDLPEYIEVDMTEVELDVTLHLSDLKLPEGVSLVALSHGADHDLPVAAVHAPKGGADDEDEASAADGDAESGSGEETKEEGEE